MKTWVKIIASLFVLSFFILPFSSIAGTDPAIIAPGERILNFKSDILVDSDGSMTVTETIKVVATNNRINHGIYRDFPTKYKDAHGNNYKVSFDIESVLQDGIIQDFHIDDESNGKRVYIGNSNVIIAPGVYTYELTYHTDRQLGFFSDHDELYWNVNGNGWEFNVENIEAHIRLPESVPKNNLEALAYTGPAGAKGIDYRSDIEDGGVNFYTTKPLGPLEGITVVISWPKGVVTEPTQMQRIKDFLKDNIPFILSLIIALGVLIYYLYVWNKAGRDPKGGSIIPQYESPRALSPAQIRYLSIMSFDDTIIVSSIINMAVKGYLKIEELIVNFRLTKIGSDETQLTSEEKILSKHFFSKSDIFDTTQENFTDLGAARAEIINNLMSNFKENYFVKNLKYLGKGLLLSLIGLIVLMSGHSHDVYIKTGFFILWLTTWSIGVYMIGKTALEKLSSQNKSGFVNTSIAFLIFLSSEVLVIYFLYTITSFAIFFYIILVMAINFIFLMLMPKRTVEGRKVQDEIEGFKWFLSVTEKDRMNFHNPPNKTPELFEKFLPYAIALGIENKWALQFEEVFNKFNGGSESTYNPSWYAGRSLSAGSLSSFASSLGSHMGGSISSSSNPPGSSSGFGGGGGGGSGGGGGGGGGGGW